MYLQVRCVRVALLWPLTSLVIHTMLLLVQATSLSVAINSYNNALITILVSNNFVELKGSVFKKFETHNLFQMSCSGKILVGADVTTVQFVFI